MGRAKRIRLKPAGEIKDIKKIKGKDKHYILIVQNNESPALYKVKSVKNM